MGRAQRVAARAAARHGVDQRLPPLHPRGGVGRDEASGTGRELGPTGLHEYQEPSTSGTTPPRRRSGGSEPASSGDWPVEPDPRRNARSPGGSMTVRFRLLGEIEVLLDGRPVDVGHARQRCVLAALLVEVNRPVPADELIDRVWAGRPPHRARNALSAYVSRLRQLLARRPGCGSGARPAGYVVAADPLAVDLHEFRHLVSQARAAERAGGRGGAVRAGAGPVARGAVGRDRHPVVRRRPRRRCRPSGSRWCWTATTRRCAPGGTPTCSSSWPMPCGPTRSTSGWPGSSCSPSSAAAGRPTR